MSDIPLDALIDRSTERLRQFSPDAGPVESLRQYAVLYEVIGRWPPDKPLSATSAEIGRAAAAVRDAIGHLVQLTPQEEAIAGFETILSRLNDAMSQSSVAPVDASQSVDDSDEGSGGQDSEVLGRWPPD